MKTKKSRFLILFLMFIISVGIFIKTEEILACGCNTIGASCIFIPVSTCSESGHGCLGRATVIADEAVCTIDGSNVYDPGGICAPVNSWSYCSESLCNTYVSGAIVNDPATNGAVCRVTTSGKDNCNNFVEGSWDNFEKKCVQCDGNNIETAVAGDSSGNYVIDPFPYSINATGAGKADGEFESACGADVACDEKNAWDACAGGICDASGVCIITAGLSLSASADPTVITVNGNSTITFGVTESGIPVEGALVDSISLTAGGGNISGNNIGCTSDYCCTTNASGECAVTYNAPAIPTVATITATKATKLGSTESGLVNITVTVNAGAVYAPCGPDTGVACNPLDNTVSDIPDAIIIIIRYLLSIIGIIALLFIIISGIKYITSAGNEEKIKSAKDSLWSSILGLAVALLAYAILGVVVRILNG